MKFTILFLLISISILAQERTIILGSNKISLGESKDKIEHSFRTPFRTKSNDNTTTIYDGDRVLGYIVFENDTVKSINKIWSSDINHDNSNRFIALFNLLNQNKDYLQTAIIQLQNIKEPNIDYQAIYIDVTQYKRITIANDSIIEKISY